MRKSLRLMLTSCLSVGLWSDAAQAQNPGLPAPATAPTSAVPADPGPVAARVNEEAIYWSEVTAGLPKPGPFSALFAPDQERLRQAKLARLLNARVLRQYLKAQQIEVSAAEIDAEVEQLRKTPPASGCSCCRYSSLEQFMETLGIDMQELRVGIANDLGTQRCLAAHWQKEYPAGEKRETLLRTERPRLERTYANASHIFFNTFQNRRFDEEPEEVRDRARNDAEAAWRQLKAGESFEAVAREVSEDAISKPKGGHLGAIPRDALGKQFAEELEALKPGEFGRPVESPWGFHIIRREPMTDADLLEVLRQDSVNRWWTEEEQRLQAEAKIEVGDAK
jgi:parvulin-like peptidyl-prolyl isomerase